MGITRALGVCAFVVLSGSVGVGCGKVSVTAPSGGSGSSGSGDDLGEAGSRVSAGGNSGSNPGSGLVVVPPAGVEASVPPPPGSRVTLIRPGGVGKIDLLFMIDNSASMGDKQELLAAAVPDMLNRLVSPNCVDAAGNPTGTTTPVGVCPPGSVPEFAPVHDMHIGIVTSSLGGRGGDQCNAGEVNPTNASLNAHNDDRGELINRGGASEADVPDANPSHLLAWFPNVSQNSNAAMPPTTPIGTVGVRGQAGTLIGDFTEMVTGVHEHGCGFEAQNEAWYRFLVQPDPFDSIAVNANHASLVGFDDVILRQRADFLRPDSLLAVIVVTDENEEVANPLAIDGQGWTFETASFPGNQTNNTAPQGTIECKSVVDPSSVLSTGPNDPNCTSCAFIQGHPDFATRCPRDGTSAAPGFLDPKNDQINVRFFNQKQRFGVFAGYPTSRYIRGLTRPTVPDRNHEVQSPGNYVGDQNAFANCVNPIFAKALPRSSSDPAALCNLQRGPREASDVYYAAIAGVPHQLLQAKPGDAECPAGTNPADCPQKRTLGNADWTLITGNDPEHYDFRGVDFHMLESTAERTSQGVMANASTCPSTAADNCDPINGREWATGNGDLQFACIFKLATPKDCTSQTFAGACDCSAGSATAGTPLCQSGGGGLGGHGTAQTYGKAYPSVREMIIARAMKDQGIVSSLCPIHETEQRLDDPLYGYRPAVSAIIDRVKFSLVARCLPQKLTRDSSGHVPCNVRVTLPAGDCSGAALSAPDSSLLAAFRQSQHDEWLANGGPSSDSVDPSTLPTCKLTELTPSLNAGSFDANASCAASNAPGWCYVESSAPPACAQAVVFSAGEPPPGALVTLQCP